MFWRVYPFITSSLAVIVVCPGLRNLEEQEKEEEEEEEQEAARPVLYSGPPFLPPSPVC